MRSNETILLAAIDVAKRDGFQHMTRDKVAEEVGCAIGLINYYYRTFAELKREVIRTAISRLQSNVTESERIDMLNVVAHGIVSKDEAALRAPQEIKTEALMSLA